MNLSKLIVNIGVMTILLLVMNGASLADPCLVIYPDAPCVYHYDRAEYFTVRPGDPFYDPLYDRGGKVLVEIGTNEIAYNIYQAPSLMGFYPSTSGEDGYFVATTEFTLIIDGFSKRPTTFPNIVLVFDHVTPDYCDPGIFIWGEELPGMVYPAGDLIVTTPTANGKNYSDVISVPFRWRGCYGMRIWAFSDENFNGVHDGGECFSAYSHDTMVPVEEKTWSSIKELFR